MSDSFLDSLGRGAAQGATSGFSDEAVAKILAGLPGPDDGTGIPREYAAGSPEQDYLNSERGDNARAATANPVAYGAGQVAGGLPSALAVPAGAGGSAAARIAASGLSGGAMGALSGAGHADGGDLGQSAAQGAALGGALGTGGAAAIESLPALKAALSQLTGPQLAAEGTNLGGPQINRAGMLPPRPATGDMPAEMFIPKASKALGTKQLNAPGRSADTLAERPTMIEEVDPKKAYRAAEHRNRQSPPARGVRPTGDDTTPTGIVPPPPQLSYKNAPPSSNRATVPAPATGSPTVRAPAPQFNNTPTVPAPAMGSSTVPAPAPQFAPSQRPTMPDLGPVRPTLQPGSEQAYKDAVMQEIADSARRNSI